MMLSRIRSLLHRLYIIYLRCKFTCLGQKVVIGRNVKISPKARILLRKGEIHIGDDCSILPGAILDTYNGHIILGKNIGVNYYTVIYGHGGVTIGDNTRIAGHSMIIPANHRFENKNIPICKQGEDRQGIVIGEDVWIGGGVVVLDKSNIAKGCVIGAGSVVSGETEPYGVYVGSPAQKKKERVDVA
jgi:acetyltransferase-like isoleucine patch superfamily enzyme